MDNLLLDPLILTTMPGSQNQVAESRTMPKRQSRNPKRRVLPQNVVSLEERQRLADVLRYVGSAHHKRAPGDYNLVPPTNPRPWKSLCDGQRVILLEEANELLRRGILKGMFSQILDDGCPKYVWSVDDNGEAFEAKRDRDGYHGYRLEEDDDMRVLVLREWNNR